MNNILKDKKGMSLISTIISVGILSTATMAAMRVMVRQQKNIKYIEVKLALNEEIIDYKNRLATPINCLATVNSIPTDAGGNYTGSVDHLTDSTGTVVPSQVSSTSISNIKIYDDYATLTPATKTSGGKVLEISYALSGNYGPVLRPKLIAINSTYTAGALTSCNADSAMSAAALPVCTTDQTIVSIGTGYTCADLPSVPPDCADNQALKTVGGVFTCVDIPGVPPVCTTNQVIVKVDTGYLCKTAYVKTTKVDGILPNTGACSGWAGSGGSTSCAKTASCEAGSTISGTVDIGGFCETAFVDKNFATNTATAYCTSIESDTGTIEYNAPDVMSIYCNKVVY